MSARSEAFSAAQNRFDRTSWCALPESGAVTEGNRPDGVMARAYGSEALAAGGGGFTEDAGGCAAGRGARAMGVLNGVPAVAAGAAEGAGEAAACDAAAGVAATGVVAAAGGADTVRVAGAGPGIAPGIAFGVAPGVALGIPYPCSCSSCGGCSATRVMSARCGGGA